MLMKKILSLLLLAATFGYMSCDDDEPSLGASPTVTVDPTSGQNVPGGVVSVSVSIAAPNGGATLFIAGVDNPDVTLDGSTAQDVTVDVTVPASAPVGSVITVIFTATDKKNLSSTPVEFPITVGDPVVVLEGAITADRTLEAGTEYLLRNQVFVNSGVTLTVPAGTVVKGEKATKATLVVKPGGKLVATGTASNPVIFTSNQAVGERDRGDWGGIVILGNAYINQGASPSIEGISPAQAYGTAGTDNTVNQNENSGTLTYVRIEYGGIELSPNNETNSLTLGAVGNGTTIDYVQASFGGDDGFEWFGGTVDAKHLVSFGMWDDDFDTDFGWRGRVQYGLAVRYQSYADQSGSNAFESDTQGSDGKVANKCDDAGNYFGCTQGVFSNITVLGPRDFNGGLTGSNVSRAISGSYQNAMHIRRQSMLSIRNSFFAGFPTGLKVDEAGTLNHMTSGRSSFKNNVLLVPTNNEVGATTTATGVVYTTNISTGDAIPVKTYWTAANVAEKTTSGAGLWSSTNNIYATYGVSSDVFWAGGTANNTTNGRAISEYPANPNFALGTGSLTTGADFTGIANFFDTTVTYRGAFGEQQTGLMDGLTSIRSQQLINTS
jgi:hypothetical protein